MTPREREILQMLAEGKSNKEIASALNLSLYTVETHRRNLQEKLNLHSFPELILYAVRKASFLAATGGEAGDPFRPEAFQYMSASFIARPTSSSRNGFVNTS